MVKFNNYDELRDILYILDNNNLDFYLSNMDDYYGYILNKPNENRCIVMETFNIELLKKLYDSDSIIIHEFPTRNFINAFMD